MAEPFHASIPIGQTLLTVILAIWTGVMALIWPGILVLGTNCNADDDSRSICDPVRYGIAEWMPAWAAITGLTIAVVGCWIWPRRRRGVWLGVGYFIAFMGIGVASMAGS